MNTTQVHYASFSCTTTLIFIVDLAFSSAGLQGSVYPTEIITVIRSLWLLINNVWTNEGALLTVQTCCQNTCCWRTRSGTERQRSVTFLAEADAEVMQSGARKGKFQCVCLLNRSASTHTFNLKFCLFYLGGRREKGCWIINQKFWSSLSNIALAIITVFSFCPWLHVWVWHT